MANVALHPKHLQMKRKGSAYHKKFTAEDYEVRAILEGDCLLYGKNPGAARIVYQLRHGYLTTKQYVCHRCDNPRCILDAHHFLGTSQDNVKDLVNKGRHSSLRKGGVRFSGPHDEATRATIAEASRKMWASRTTVTSLCRNMLLQGLPDTDIITRLKERFPEREIGKQQVHNVRSLLRKSGQI